MMTTKPTTSLRDRRISPSPARPSPKTSLSRRDNTSLPEAKKTVPNYLKPRAVSISESPTRRIPIVPAIAASSASKTTLARRLADKASSPSTPALQRSLKPATPTLKPGSSSILHGDKAAQTVSRTARTDLVLKAKSTTPTLAKKKESPATIAATSEVNISSDHDAVTVFERPVQDKVVKALNELKNVDESRFISSLVEEENHLEEQKSGEPENGGEVSVPQVFDEVSKEPVVLEEVPKQAGEVVAATLAKKRDEEKKLEHVDAAVRPVDQVVRKLMLGATVVTAIPAVKKKDPPLINDVIEETKSKLMEKRKNKVLALVGAFETVISLQEPEGQQIQKALQVQHGPQIHQDQQAELSFENQQAELRSQCRRRRVIHD